MLECLSSSPIGTDAAIEAGIDEASSFDAEILVKRTGTWTGAKAVLIDRQPYGERTHFRHRLRRHAIALHLEGANSRTALRYESGPQVVTGSTLGQVMLIPAEHQLEGWSDFPAKIRHMILLFDPGLFRAEAQENPRLDGLELPYRLDLADGVIASRMRALQVEFDNPGLMGRLYAESLSTEIAVRIVRAHLAPAGLTAPARGGLAPRRLRTVLDYIEANLSGEITLSALAAIAGISNTHFCRAFHKSAGVTSHQYIIRRRVERAKALLAGSERSIAEIALSVGFGNQSHMTTHFRRVVGTTPRRFRIEA